MKMTMVLIITIMVVVISSTTFAKNGIATLAFCKIEDTSGQITYGLIHVLTNYGLNDLSVSCQLK